MTLVNELEQSTASGCRLCLYLDSLEDREEWDSALAQPVTKVGNTAVVKALRKRGVVLTEASVRRHRVNHAT